MKRLLFVAIPLSVLVAIFLFGQATKDKNGVTVEEAHNMIATDTSIVILDVRTQTEFTGNLGHIKGALLIPIQELEQRIDELQDMKGKTILAVCRTGRRSGVATDLLITNGYKSLNVEGGMVQWNQNRYPVSREP